MFVLLHLSENINFIRDQSKINHISFVQLYYPNLFFELSCQKTCICIIICYCFYYTIYFDAVIFVWTLYHKTSYTIIWYCKYDIRITNKKNRINYLHWRTTNSVASRTKSNWNQKLTCLILCMFPMLINKHKIPTIMVASYDCFCCTW